MSHENAILSLQQQRLLLEIEFNTEREAYRRQKDILGPGFDVVFIYILPSLATYDEVFADMTSVLKELSGNELGRRHSEKGICLSAYTAGEVLPAVHQSVHAAGVPLHSNLLSVCP